MFKKEIDNYPSPLVFVSDISVYTAVENQIVFSFLQSS